LVKEDSQLVNVVLQSANEVLQLVNEVLHWVIAVLQSVNEVLQSVNVVLHLTIEVLHFSKFWRFMVNFLRFWDFSTQAGNRFSGNHLPEKNIKPRKYYRFFNFTDLISLIGYQLGNFVPVN
jgi:hypothetical protein